MIINVVHDVFGLDKIGDTYGLKGYAIAHELRLFDGNAHIQCERVRYARNFTAWCLFIFDKYVLDTLSTCCITKIEKSVILLGNSFASPFFLGLLSLRFLTLL